MSHLVETMAFVGQTPWHDLGNRLAPKQSIEVWSREAGMDWRILSSPVCYQPQGEQPSPLHFDDHQVLYRSDTNAPLSVVSGRYQVVQPREVLEFFRDLTTASGYELETAGVLKQGKRFWALARTGQSTVLKGSDAVTGYLLLASSCDGSLATIAMPTTIRVVCNNTLAIALNNTVGSVKVPHRTVFDANVVKRQLGIAVSQWDGFMVRMKALAERKVKTTEAQRYITRVICDVAPNAPLPSAVSHERALKRVEELFNGSGRGSELAAAKGTAWGLMNAVTEFVDHERRARSQEYRLDSAWFGQGAVIKQRALEQALQLIA
jgi:phage/plasmid-like protein (TIGR03299 family)